ncbi:MAG: SAM-dependent methyltransferase HcgC family protein [Methanobacteriaceae archaeon]|nr:SAM-dependent methyltransferase HcgC family protein [Methanobacteriaceae archaeon]MDP3485769.1 SAM-dependent methyltransferase HcgC family protein [Methanobacteriaceae archaeon]
MKITLIAVDSMNNENNPKKDGCKNLFQYTEEQTYFSKIETGITSMVTTSYSSLTIWDIIKIIAGKKSDAVNEWINSLPVQIEMPVVAGTYLTGASLAQKLVQRKEIKEVEVLDIYPHLNELLYTSWDVESKDSAVNEINNAKISFSTDLYHLKTGDMVIDTTGLGGIDVNQIKELTSCEVFLAEDPSSDGSDDLIQSKNFTQKRIDASSANHRGLIFTSGLGSKTSGTMTLTMDVLRKSLEEVLKEEGVLYAVASLDFYERILFKEENTEKFLETLQRPAMVASSLKAVDLDTVLAKQLAKIRVTIKEDVGKKD